MSPEWVKQLRGLCLVSRTRLDVEITKIPMLCSVRNKEAWFLAPEEALETSLLLG